jgi:hypothetical protein
MLDNTELKDLPRNMVTPVAHSPRLSLTPGIHPVPARRVSTLTRSTPNAFMTLYPPPSHRPRRGSDSTAQWIAPRTGSPSQSPRQRSDDQPRQFLSRGTESLQTRRWREPDSKCQFRAEMGFVLGSRRVTGVPARRRRRVTVIEFV